MALWFRGATSYERDESARFTSSRGLEGIFPRNFAAGAVSCLAFAAQLAKQSFFERNCTSYAENVFLKAAKVKAQIQRQLIFLSQDIYEKNRTDCMKILLKCFRNGMVTVHYTTLKFHLYTVPRIAFPRMVILKY